MRTARSGNPVLNKNTFAHLGAGHENMTIDGTVNRTALLLFALIIPAGLVWQRFMAGDPVLGFMIGGLVAGFVLAIITVFKQEWAPYTAPLYAIAQGAALGGISAMFEQMFPGIVIQAVALTFAVLFALLAAYKSGMIKVTENFKLGIIAATGGVFLLYAATFVLGFFGIQIPYIHGSGPIGIGFSVVVIIIAALNLVLDFDFIESGAEQGAPKYMEWFGAFGLLVTLVWLYLEILHLLAKMRK